MFEFLLAITDNASHSEIDFELDKFCDFLLQLGGTYVRTDIETGSGSNKSRPRFERVHRFKFIALDPERAMDLRTKVAGYVRERFGRVPLFLP
jgi:hypothetical protein